MHVAGILSRTPLALSPLEMCAVVERLAPIKAPSTCML